MFGLSFGELVVCAILALVVLGPKELPAMLRTLGRTLAKLRRVTTDLRKQSGIDEIIREENLHEELAALRSLRGMSASNVVETFIEKASSPRARTAATLAAVAASQDADDPYAPEDPEALPPLPALTLEGTAPDPAVEYPEAGCDDYGAAAASAATATETRGDQGSSSTAISPIDVTPTSESVS